MSLTSNPVRPSLRYFMRTSFPKEFPFPDEGQKLSDQHISKAGLPPNRPFSPSAQSRTRIGQRRSAYFPAAVIRTGALLQAERTIPLELKRKLSYDPVFRRCRFFDSSHPNFAA